MVQRGRRIAVIASLTATVGLVLAGGCPLGRTSRGIDLAQSGDAAVTLVRTSGSDSVIARAVISAGLDHLRLTDGRALSVNGQPLQFDLRDRSYRQTTPSVEPPATYVFRYQDGDGHVSDTAVTPPSDFVITAPKAAQTVSRQAFLVAWTPYNEGTVNITISGLSVAAPNTTATVGLNDRKDGGFLVIGPAELANIADGPIRIEVARQRRVDAVAGFATGSLSATVIAEVPAVLEEGGEQ